MANEIARNVGRAHSALPEHRQQAERVSGQSVARKRSAHAKTASVDEISQDEPPRCSRCTGVRPAVHSCCRAPASPAPPACAPSRLRTPGPAPAMTGGRRSTRSPREACRSRAAAPRLRGARLRDRWPYRPEPARGAGVADRAPCSRRRDLARHRRWPSSQPAGACGAVGRSAPCFAARHESSAARRVRGRGRHLRVGCCETGSVGCTGHENLRARGTSRLGKSHRAASPHLLSRPRGRCPSLENSVLRTRKIATRHREAVTAAKCGQMLPLRTGGLVLADQPPRGCAQPVIVTGTPELMCVPSHAISTVDRRTHPCETAVPGTPPMLAMPCRAT